LKNCGEVLASEGLAPSSYLAARTDRMILIADLETLIFGAPHIYIYIYTHIYIYTYIYNVDGGSESPPPSIQYKSLGRKQEITGQF
jgi:hypothetical protein